MNYYLLLSLLHYYGSAILFAEVEIFDATEKENIAHLLASMHLAVSEYGGVGRKSGKLRYVTNTTFERFVEL